MRNTLFSLLLIAIAATSLSFTTALHRRSTQQSALLKKLAKRLTGSFNSAEQSKIDQSYFDVSLNSSHIWKDRADGYWIYVEQAITRSPKKPYRQRVYHMTQVGDTLYSRVFELPHPETFINKYNQPTALAGITPDSLISREGCKVVLTYQKGVFSGATHNQDCLSDFKEATYATSNVKIFKDHIESWDRGYNAKNEQVWGADKGPYKFLRTGKYPF